VQYVGVQSGDLNFGISSSWGGGGLMCFESLIVGSGSLSSVGLCINTVHCPCGHKIGGDTCFECLRVRLRGAGAEKQASPAGSRRYRGRSP